MGHDGGRGGGMEKDGSRVMDMLRVLRVSRR